ncbi:MAG: response regulator [Deltaproteobacteria bacterium]|nr:response regulator [Deltaproteobacteria bacterium]
MSPSGIDADPRILGQLLAAQSTLSVFSARQRMGEFMHRAVEGMPGVASCAVCLPGGARPRLGGEPAAECAACDVPDGDIDHDPGHPCRLASRANMRVFPLRTQDRHFGFLLLQVEERERYAPYEPFVGNLANGLAVNIERQWHRDRLEAANVELRRHRDHLEELVKERTAALQLGLERARHLNAVLRAIRNVNQLITRARDRDRLLQEACAILAETRGFRCVWFVAVTPDGRFEAAAEAGIGAAFARVRAQLERGELPECCRRALASATPVVVADPVANCGACPVAPQYRDTAGLAVAMRHLGKTYGVLVAALPAEMADDAGELSLFCEVAGDLAFALYDIDLGRQHQRAEAASGRLQEQFQQAQKMEAVGRLAGGVAHDFNNLLSIILSNCSFALEGLGEGDPRREEITDIKEAGERAANLTRQLLSFSRRQMLQPRVLDLNGLITDLHKMLPRLLGEDIAIVLALAPTLGLVRADPGQLEQVIVNLAVNARDAMPDGGRLLVETADVELDEDYVRRHVTGAVGPFVRLTVSDTGCGMDPETQAKVFEPFFTTKEKGKGTGLGLSTVYGIVKQSNGFIWVYSEPGRGATFKVYLPRVTSAEQPWRPANGAETLRGGDETILLVEDDAEVRAAATRALRNLGYRVLEADGLEAARRVAASAAAIQLLLTDVVMPGGSGREVGLAVTAAHPAAKVLYMSGYTDNAILHHGVLEPGVAFVQKPFTPDVLGRKVREVLDGGDPGPPA